MVHKEITGSNLAGILIKCLTRDKRKYLIERMMTNDKVKSYAMK